MAHIHEIKDAETHFIIDATTREISNAGALPALGQKDHNSEIFTFVAPRYVDNHDLSICNKVRVHYLNIESDTRKVYADIYEVADLHIDEADKTKVVFTWLISNYSTQLAGLLNFAIEFSCEKDGVIDYSWNTAIFTGIVVKKGINNAAQIITEYTDILEKWKQDVIKELTQNVNSHDHENIKTLAKFSCMAADMESDDGFTILPDVIGVDRLNFWGNEIRYCSDGAVINRIEAINKDDAKFLRLYLKKSIALDFGDIPDFIDIPVNAVNEVEEEGFDFTLNGSELELPTGGDGTGGLTPEQLADLEANTAARHEHENKGVLDSFGLSEDLQLMFGGDMVLTTANGGATLDALEQLKREMEDYVADAINGSLDEIEAMIDEIETLINESGVLDDES